MRAGLRRRRRDFTAGAPTPPLSPPPLRGGRRPVAATRRPLSVACARRGALRRCRPYVSDCMAWLFGRGGRAGLSLRGGCRRERGGARGGEREREREREIVPGGRLWLGRGANAAPSLRPRRGARATDVLTGPLVSARRPTGSVPSAPGTPQKKRFPVDPAGKTLLTGGKRSPATALSSVCATIANQSWPLICSAVVLYVCGVGGGGERGGLEISGAAVGMLHSPCLSCQLSISPRRVAGVHGGI